MAMRERALLARWVAALAVAAAVAIAALQVRPASAQAPLPPVTPVAQMSPMTLAGRLDRTCVRRIELGRCPVFPYVRRLIQMNVPVAYVETTRQPGETTVKSPALLTHWLAFGELGRTVSQTRSFADSTSEAHVYTLPVRLILSAGLGPLNMVCTQSDATAPDATSPAASATLLSRATCGNLLGDVAAMMTSKLAGAFDGALSEALCTPRPVYFSELDVPNWRTGCGDLTIANPMLSNAFTCEARRLHGRRQAACGDHLRRHLHRQLGRAVPAADARARPCWPGRIGQVRVPRYVAGAHELRRAALSGRTRRLHAAGLSDGVALLRARRAAARNDARRRQQRAGRPLRLGLLAPCHLLRAESRRARLPGASHGGGERRSPIIATLPADRAACPPSTPPSRRRAPRSCRMR